MQDTDSVTHQIANPPSTEEREDIQEMASAVEALLFASAEPLTLGDLRRVLAIRGVDCTGVVSTLMLRGLVTEVGRLETVGHPILYGTTLAFLQHFGLESPDQLPSAD